MDPRLVENVIDVNGLPTRIRTFGDPRLQGMINAALADESANGGVVLDADFNGNGDIEAVFVAKPNGHWSIAGAFSKGKGQPIGVGVRIAYKW